MIKMKTLASFLVTLGLLLLAVALASRFVLGKPFSLLGVRAMTLIVLANTSFLLAALLKLFEKK
jgi:hypothetical protein